MTTHESADLTARHLWRALLVVGLLFAVIGGLELGMLWYPLQIGTMEWELGTVSAFFDLFPIFGLGLLLVMGAGLALGARWTVRIGVAVALLLAVFMWGAAVLYATTLPAFLKAISNPIMLTALKKGMAKTGVQVLFYPFGLLWLAAIGWRASVKRRDG